MRILAIDDKIEDFNEALSDALHEYEMRFAPSGEQGLLYARQDPDLSLVLLDIKMPPLFASVEEREGIEVLKRFKAELPHLPVIMLSVFEERRLVIEAIREGAVHYLVKPLDIDELQSAVARVIEEARAKEEASALRRALRERDSISGPFPPDADDHLGALLGQSEAMRRLYTLIKRVAPSPAPVLITGESGTGKEIVAREIHAASARTGGEFEPVNTAAIPSELLESELFGHVKGAFTHATENKTGCIERANEGTLFLDEIGDMPISLQAKLLRVLQDGMVRPVGAQKAKEVDFRLICATHRDLRESIDRGEFREDLFFRINVLPVALPPLREREGDLEFLTERFLKDFSSAGPTKAETPSITGSAWEALKAHPWRGNVRELRNVIERAVILSQGEDIGPEYLLLEQRTAPASSEAGGRPVSAEQAPPRIARQKEVNLRVTDLAEFKKQYGEEGLREALLWGLKEAYGDQLKAMREIGYVTDADDESSIKKKHAAFRQMLKRLGINRGER